MERSSPSTVPLRTSASAKMMRLPFLTIFAMAKISPSFTLRINSVVSEMVVVPWVGSSSASIERAIASSARMT